MKTCETCGAELPEYSRFCMRCGRPLESETAGGDHRAGPPESPVREEMNPRVLYAMVLGLVVAVLFPPWETAPGEPPEFLGFHFILTGPEPPRDGVISRFLWMIELVTIAIAGFYFSWFFRKTHGNGL